MFEELLGLSPYSKASTPSPNGPVGLKDTPIEGPSADSLIQQLLGGVPTNPQATSAVDSVRAGFGAHGNLGKILGALGDAFLVQGGAAPAYGNRVKAARISDALGSMDSDTTAAVQGIAAQDPDLAVSAMRANEMAQYRQAQADLAREKQKEAATKATHTRAFSLIGAATPDTYDAVKKRYYDYYASKGMEPLIDLPDKYDREGLAAALRAGVDPTNQLKIDESVRQHDLSDANSDANRSAANARASMAEDGRNSRFEQQAPDRAIRRDNVIDLINQRRLNGGKRRENIDSTIKTRNFNLQHPNKNRIGVFPEAPPAAIAKLKSDPSLANYFDQKYGPGSSKSILGN